MKIEMSKDAANAVEASVMCASVAFAVVMVFYFFVVVWWAGISESNTEKELERHKTCYQEWKYNEAHQTRWLRIAYCGEHGPSYE